MSLPIFPQIAGGKPLLAITNRELETVIADAEEAYVFLSGLDRDLAVSDKLQAIREHRKSYGVVVTRSRLIVQGEVWGIPGPSRKVYGPLGWRGWGFVCILPNNEVIRTNNDRCVRFGPEVRFTAPATGYYIEVTGVNYEDTELCIHEESFNGDKQFECDVKNVPYGPFQ